MQVHLNTSTVKVKPTSGMLKEKDIQNLNTSTVKVKHKANNIDKVVL